MDNVKLTLPTKFKGLMRPHRYYVYYGGRGSAKSWSIAQYLVWAAMSRPLKILCTRELQNSITESVHSLLSDIIIGSCLFDCFKIKNASIECNNGSVFIFKGLAHNIDSIKSTEGVDICWIEEADKVSQNSWDILIPTIRKPASKLIISFNPTHQDDPVYKMFIEVGQPESLVQKVNYQDNPYFPEVLRREMLHMKATDYDKYLHVWEGELRTISDAQVFRGKFVVEEFEYNNETLYHGMDFGFSNDPMAITRSFIRGQDLYIDREEYAFHTEISEMPTHIRRILRDSEWMKWKIKADCSRPETISYLKHANINIGPAKKWAGSIEDGIEYLRGFRKIIIHPRCPKTAEEFKRYSYKIDRRTNEILPIVIDDFNHCIDSLRYALDDLIKGKVTIYDDGVL